MEISISSRNLELSDSLVSTTLAKVGRLGRLNGSFRRAVVHFYEERNPRIADRDVCEIVLDGNGRQVHCKVAAPDGHAAVDKAVAKLEHQLHKLKTQTLIRTHGG
ncbi:MAG: ribosome-associated translation inhibitor RaiA [Acidimicrobiales bacterium]|nr:ribosome-associated translation inhibitor RaiA [Acidimicrobiales bacterium]